VAHKYVLELAERVRRAVNLSAGPDEQLLGNVHLRVRKDASVCSTLAREGYEEDLGARSLINAVRHVVEETVVEAYLDVDEEIFEGQEIMEFVVNIVGTGRERIVTVRPLPRIEAAKGGGNLNDLDDDESEGMEGG